MSLLSSIGKTVTKALDVNQALFANPKTFFISGPNAAIAKTQSTSPTKNAVAITKNTAIATVGILAGASTAGRAAIASVAKLFVPKTATQAIAATVAVPVAAKVLSTSSKARSAVVNAPSSISNVGENLGKLIDNPSISGAKELITENPLLIGGTAAAALGGAALALAPTLATHQNTKAIQENSQQMINPAQQIYQALPAQQIELIIPAQTPLTSPSTAVAAPTETLAAPAVQPSKPKKKKKKSKKKS